MLSWDEDICRWLNIPMGMLPTPVGNSEIYGESAAEFLGGSIRIAGAAGDQQSALFGQGCFNRGEAKNTYGTGCFLLMNTGNKPIDSKNLLTTIALGMDGNVDYALEGSVFMGGAIIKWLRDELGMIKTAHEIDILAESVPDANGVFLVPAFVGLGAPYWDMYARGTITGLTRGVKREHICRAALEAIAFQVKDVLDCMVKESGIPLASLQVDGGASVSNVMMQFQADILGVKVVRPQNVETTALGAAFLAGLATGFWKDRNEILKIRQTDRCFEPQMEAEKKSSLYAGWMRAVERSRGWIEAERGE